MGTCPRSKSEMSEKRSGTVSSCDLYWGEKMYKLKISGCVLSCQAFEKELDG